VKPQPNASRPLSARLSACDHAAWRFLQAGMRALHPADPWLDEHGCRWPKYGEEAIPMKKGGVWEMDYEPIYMVPRALQFIRAWPNVPKDLRPAYSYFYDAKLIYLDPNVDDPGDGHRNWPGSLRLTEEGERIRDLACAQTNNFFRIPEVFKSVPAVDLEELPEDVGHFFALFQLAPDWPDLQKWMRATLREPRRGVRAGVQLQREPMGLKLSLARLGVAADRLAAAALK
jgi:hypothetical protein